ncbi:unnamed protein product [Didymodactylos carnosus]|uniref:Uncharacterized protein n=1 Tax=Didymodactylos carnosus TaxID=1234261 RepID=A0A814UAH8_9BILA|nr:unnamed protein product [Didymodactylos carnosus]CAF1172276.1 unnamed protein product [Didymodactylos carnosus]CAF3636431.1 unnamed protein product [Didymodactylos carnosus]CAF3936194.1 unnamed protein product [Didymodactylos carnosus]
MDSSSTSEENTTAAAASYSLYWLDTNANDAEPLQNRLKNIVNNNNFRVFENLEDCEGTIRLSVEEIIVLIVSDSRAVQLVSRVHDLRRVLAIYVYGSNEEFHLLWIKNFKKVKNAIVHENDLIYQIQKAYRYCQPLGRIKFFSNADQSQQQSHKNLKLENVTFVWQQLFIEILLRLKQEE